MLARAAAGSVRDSLSLTDQAIAFGSGRILATQVADMLGAVGGDLVWPLLEKAAAGDGPGALDEVERIAERGLSCDQALHDMAAILHRVAMAQHGVEPEVDDADRARIVALATCMDAGRIQVMYQIAVLGRRDLSLAPDELSGLGMVVMRMLSFGTPVPVGRPVVVDPRGAVALSSGSGSGAPLVNEGAATHYAPQAQSGASSTFDGDWRGFVESQNFQGMAGLLARHAEMSAFEGNHLQLVLPEAQKMYAEPPYQDKLRTALAPRFGSRLRLSVSIGETTGASVAAVRDAEAQRKQQTAAAALESDPFVRDLVDGMGAKIIASSIRQAGDGEVDNLEQGRL